MHAENNDLSFTLSNLTSFNPLPNDNFLDLTKFKALADDKLNVAKIMISFLTGLKTLWEMETMLVYQHFLLFPHRFQKTSFSGLLKVEIIS